MGLDLLKWSSRALLFATILSMATFFFASFNSDGVSDEDSCLIVSSTQRSLLQTKKPCALNFEYMNCTTITSRCKGPRYPREECCDAFLQFACPYADEINDLSTNCATTMFSYLTLKGSYPPGLFANQCQGDGKGLLCPENYVMNSLADSGLPPPPPAAAVAVASSLLGFLSLLGVF